MADAATSAHGDGGEPDEGEPDAGPDAGYPGAWNEGQWVVGHARFTAITPTLVRMEYHPEGRFVDAPSYFAVEREARFHHALTKEEDGSFTIDTGKLRLTFRNDGAQLSEANLTASQKRGAEWVTFSPAAQNPDNLGGTTRTLDNWTGAAKLDDGILTRAGWYRLDDSSGH
jgi:hypothetical protein